MAAGPWRCKPATPRTCGRHSRSTSASEAPPGAFKRRCANKGSRQAQASFTSARPRQGKRPQTPAMPCGSQPRATHPTGDRRPAVRASGVPMLPASARRVFAAGRTPRRPVMTLRSDRSARPPACPGLTPEPLIAADLRACRNHWWLGSATTYPPSQSPAGIVSGKAACRGDVARGSLGPAPGSWSADRLALGSHSLL
jgi:hypothetical protein